MDGRVLVMVCIVALAGAGLATGLDNGSMNATPATTYSDQVTHTVTVDVNYNSSGAWRSFTVDMRDIPDDTDVDGNELEENEEVFNYVREDDIHVFGIDRGGTLNGTEFDVDVKPHIQGAYPSKHGQALDIELDGELELEEGDRIVLEYGDATNPSNEDEYLAELLVNQGQRLGGGNNTTSVNIFNDGAVEFPDQETNGTNVTISQVDVPEGGFVTIREADVVTFERTPEDEDDTGGGQGPGRDDEVDPDGGETIERLVPGETVASSDYLFGGQYEELQVYFDEPWEPDPTSTGDTGGRGGPRGGGTGGTASGSATLFAVVHHDANEDRRFDADDLDQPYLYNWSEDDSYVVEANATWVPLNDSAEVTLVEEPDEETVGPRTVPPDEERDTPSPTPTPAAPGFGVLVAVLAALLATTIGLRRDG